MPLHLSLVSKTVVLLHFTVQTLLDIFCQWMYYTQWRCQTCRCHHHLAVKLLHSQEVAQSLLSTYALAVSLFVGNDEDSSALYLSRKKREILVACHPVHMHQLENGWLACQESASKCLTWDSNFPLPCSSGQSFHLLLLSKSFPESFPEEREGDKVVIIMFQI